MHPRFARRSVVCALITAVAVAAVPVLALAGDWPQLLGPSGTGVADGNGLAGEFADGKPKVAWQANVGLGSAPVAVSAGRVYAFGLFKPAAKPADLASPNAAPTWEEVTRGEFPSGDLPGTPDYVKKAEYPPAYRGDLYAQCLDAATGKQVWASKLTDFGLAYKTNKHGGTGWELASPLIADGKLYIHTHTGHLYCLDAADGKILWDVNLFEHRMFTWHGGQQGNSCSPLKAGGNIVVSYEGGAAADDPKKETGRLAVGAFDAATGAEKWVTQAPFGGMNVKTARIALAVLNIQPTVLCSCGGGTMGVDPVGGKILWSFDLAAANPDTMKKVPAAYESLEKTASDYRKDAMRPPFPGYCPLAWESYVVDAACVGHNSVTSSTWCLKIEQGRATRVWQTNELVPQSSSLKSHMAVRDGKLYAADSYFPGFARTYNVTRPYRGEKVGEFQCRDIATGKLLWSTDAFNPEPVSVKRADAGNYSILLAGSHLIVSNSQGLWIARLEDAGVKVLAHVPQAGAKLGRMLAEPVLVDGRLFVRQLDGEPKAGLLPSLGVNGNLTCLDLTAGK